MMKLSKFSWLMTKVGCIGFGGGSALIPVMEQKFLKENQVDTAENYDRDVVVASITPGALPVEIAGSLGRRNFGRKGMILGAVTMALPGALGALLLFTLLSTMQTEMFATIKIASVGISSFIIFLLVKYIENMLIACKKESKDRLKKAIFLMVLVCLLVCGGNLYKLLGIDRTPLFAVPTIYVLMAAFFVAFYTRSNYSMARMVVSGILCVIYLLGHGKSGSYVNSWLLYATEILMVLLACYGGISSIRHTKFTYNLDKKNLLKDLGVWLIFLLVLSFPALIASREVLPFLGKSLLSAWMSFGGGDAYLTIADGLFVEGGMITPENYYGEIVAVVNILPGSILCKTLVGVGYYMGLQTGGSVVAGVLFAIAGFAASIAASCSSFGLIYYLYDSLTNSKIFVVISRWIRPIIAGFLINIMLSLCNQNKVVQTYTHASVPLILICTLVLAVANYLLSRFKKVKSGWLLLMNLLVVFLIF